MKFYEFQAKGGLSIWIRLDLITAVMRYGGQQWQLWISDSSFNVEFRGDLVNFLKDELKESILP